MSYPAKVIANAFLEKAQKTGEQLTPMKLQKLIYYAHGWYLAIQGKPLIDEYLEAWNYGPVVNSVYIEFRCFGSAPITKLATQYDQVRAQYIVPMPFEHDHELHNLVDSIWQNYGQYSALELSEMTHYKGAPWDTVKSDNPTMRNVQIPNEVIESYFSDLLRPVHAV
ncbi:Panacea domain-containing protein [Pseudoalteromonas obscura]|uniref:DUF4065 domain-containing protein n=1 Tax=Pseudoalteromonas obscura TaxID=3048491 RepID=A0ABT7EUC4_9GAMM|nr:type II toxin-antitoxin system antitoxin SocA domain-containing protein [Pseudoalteromonas sp. P94(2023)]MDK2598654.1 DUF4065 domain-containing protein [Pseudoalteromonas sp. P94(2023)]